MGKLIIGVFGPGEGATLTDLDCAYELGVQIAQRDWVLLTGGRNAGVMDSACRGAKSTNGFTLALLPSFDTRAASEALDLAIPTGLGSARNNLNALACDAAIACGIGLGTISEVALTLKAQKPVILLNWSPALSQSFAALAPGLVATATSPSEAIAFLEARTGRPN